MSVVTTTTTTEMPGLIASSGSGSFMAAIGIVGGSSCFFMILVAFCCRWLIKFTSVEQREVRRKAEFEAMQREQERLMKALLEMNSTEAATQRRADREKQKLIEKMNKQEEIRIKNERQKEKKLRELQYELRKDGADMVLEGFDDSDDDGHVPGQEMTSGSGGEAIKKDNNNNSSGATAAASGGGGGGNDSDAESPEAKRRRKKQEEDDELDFPQDLPDADEGDPILSLPPPVHVNDQKFFSKTTVHDAAKQGRLVPSMDVIGYRKPWEEKELPKQRFVPGRSIRKMIPTNGDDCPKPPVVVYDETEDKFVYRSHEDHQADLERERQDLHKASGAREKAERIASAKRAGGKSSQKPNFDEMDEGEQEAELPPIQEAWTENKAEIPLARVKTTIRSANEVKLQGSRWKSEDMSSL